MSCNEINYYVAIHRNLNIYNGDDYCVAQHHISSLLNDKIRPRIWPRHSWIPSNLYMFLFLPDQYLLQSLFVNRRGTFSLQMLIYFSQVRQAVCMTMWKYLTAKGQTIQVWVDSVETPNPPLCVLQLMFC